MELTSHGISDIYPIRWQRTARTLDGSEYFIRPIRPEDRQREQAFISTLSATSRYNRMMSTLRELPPALLEQFVHVDYQRTMAFVATVQHDRREQIIGIARYAASGPSAEAEFAVTVADTWQSRGVGTELLRRLLDYATDQGLTRLYGTILASNTKMLRLASRLGFHTRPSRDDTRIVEAWYDLSSREASVPGPDSHRRRPDLSLP